MKLIYCPKCKDIIKLTMVYRTCFCGQSSGKYLNYINAEIHGEAIPIGILNTEFQAATQCRPKEVKALFEAFVIPESSLTVKKV